MDPEALVQKIDELNRNLRDLTPVMAGVRGELKTLNAQFKYTRALAFQIKLLNQIMLQTSKAAGISGMVGSLVTSLTRLVDKSR
jgi:hypothetical protein